MADLEIRINTDSLNTNTVLARDVATETGFILVTKNTMLNDSIIEKLIEMKIPYVYIKLVDYLTENSSAKHKPVERSGYIKNLRNNFDAFSIRHEQSVISIQDSFKNISNGGNINPKNLYEITDEIMLSMHLQTDILTYLNFLKITDDYTYSHSLNVSMLCNLFGRWMGLQYIDLVDLTVAGLLHDIGKTEIPNEILTKPTKLSKDEFEIIKTHPILGYEKIKKQNINEEIKKAVLFHHEKVDGSGYPYNLTGDKIGNYAKIVSICDIYDAMTANRSYRAKICPFEVIHDFESNRYGQLDTQYLLMFLSNIAYAYTSSNVLLSNNKRGEIVFINSSLLSKPIVMVENEFVDLSQEKYLEIIEII